MVSLRSLHAPSPLFRAVGASDHTSVWFIISQKYKYAKYIRTGDPAARKKARKRRGDACVQFVVLTREWKTVDQSFSEKNFLSLK